MPKVHGFRGGQGEIGARRLPRGRGRAADEAELEEIDGDQRSFLTYIADLTGQEVADVREEIQEWLTGELPSDVVMDPRHNDHSIALSGKFVPEGEDVYDDDARFGDDRDD